MSTSSCHLYTRNYGVKLIEKWISSDYEGQVYMYNYHFFLTAKERETNFKQNKKKHCEPTVPPFTELNRQEKAKQIVINMLSALLQGSSLIGGRISGFGCK